jgi:hypothetical protein
MEERMMKKGKAERLADRSCGGCENGECCGGCAYCHCPWLDVTVLLGGTVVGRYKEMDPETYKKGLYVLPKGAKVRAALVGEVA